VSIGARFSKADYKTMEGNAGQEQLLVSKEAVLIGAHLKDASVGFDEYGQTPVHLEFDSQGAKIFEEVTSRHSGKRLAIILDGRLHSATVIQERIPSGEAQIFGNFTAGDAHDLALVLSAESLPVPVKIIEERTNYKKFRVPIKKY
jgi:protein-export membrane protein SecD